MEADPVTAFQVFEELATIGSTVGWNLQLTAGIDLIMQWIPDTGMDEVFSTKEEVIVAGTWHPPGSAIPVDGGYKVTGQWAIATGCQYANWFFTNAAIMDGEEMRLHENGDPILIFLLVPSSEGTVVDTWNTMGMRGTGSHDIKLEDVFVLKYVLH